MQQSPVQLIKGIYPYFNTMRFCDAGMYQAFLSSWRRAKELGWNYIVPYSMKGHGMAGFTGSFAKTEEDAKKEYSRIIAHPECYSLIGIPRSVDYLISRYSSKVN